MTIFSEYFSFRQTEDDPQQSLSDRADVPSILCVPDRKPDPRNRSEEKRNTPSENAIPCSTASPQVFQLIRPTDC